MPRRRRPAPTLGRASWSVIALAAVFAFRKLDDFDTWWHLAAGRWIALHHTIPSVDVLSHTVRGQVWNNLEWGFELLAYALHAMVGPAGLALACVAGFAITIALLLRLMRSELGATGAAVLAMLVVLVVQDRMAARPEILSFPLLAALMTLLDRARRGETYRAWLLVPLMIVWVNVHGLFIIGVFAIVCGVASAPSRRLATWGGAAIAAVVVNPHGIAGALLPVKLLMLIGKVAPELQSIAEFRSPFAADAGGLPLAVYELLLIAGTAAVIAAIVTNLKKRVDWGALLFFAGLAGLSVLARRNAALFAIGAAPLIARSLAKLPLRESVRSAFRRAAPRLSWATVVSAALLAVLVVTGWYYRFDRQPREFGAGVLEGTFPVRAAAFARSARLPGKLYNDLAAGGYLTWDDPIGDGVYVDGRLEVYGTPFIAGYITGMYDPARFRDDTARYGVQTVVLFHRWENRRLLAGRLAADPDWALVYADEVAVIFVRRTGNDDAIARAESAQDPWNAKTRAWLERPAPRWVYPAGRVEGTRSFAGLLAVLGDDEGSAEAFKRLIRLGIPRAEEADLRLRLAKFYRSAGREAEARAIGTP